MSTTPHRLDLPALDGANPLGFLAALGTLVTLVESGEGRARLGWTSGAVLHPYLSGLQDPGAICDKLCVALRGREVSADAETARAAAQKEFEASATRLKKAKDAFKKRSLRGTERRTACVNEVQPLEEEWRSCRAAFLDKLSAAVPRHELSIGKKVDLDSDEYRTKAKAFLGDVEFGVSACAMLAALAVESRGRDRCSRTFFDFVDSSGRLAFLETARQLMLLATPEKLRATLFEPWQRQDERWSLRFDPVEDRRYALLDRDPTANDNKSRSEWMANLLAYRALSLFPCALTRRGGATTGWVESSETSFFTWPIWSDPLAPDTIRSLLGHKALGAQHPGLALRLMGVRVAYRARRVSNGDYINFSPAFALF